MATSSYLASGKQINPLIGVAGMSAFPMSARLVQKVGLEANPHSHLLMHAAGATTAGQIAPVVAGGRRGGVPTFPGAGEILVAAGHFPAAGLGRIVRLPGRQSWRGLQPTAAARPRG